ncbi:MAG: hypothetical protein R3F42_15020 [Pseudomonadota bacterium]
MHKRSRLAFLLLPFLLIAPGAGAMAAETRLVSSQPKADGDFGRAVALAGPWLVIGALLEDSGLPPAPQGGAAYVYRRQADGSYTEYQRLVAADAGSIDDFGISVAISGNTLVIGASEHDVSGLNNAGAAYVFELATTGCSVGCWQPAAQLTAGTPVAGGSFGNAVAIDGDTLIVGAKGEQAAYLYQRNTGVWTPTVRLAPATGQDFGVSVALSGDYCAVGADQANSFTGAVYVFNRNLASGWGLEDTLAGQSILDAFGFTLDLAGDRLVVGAPGAVGTKPGSARLYTRAASGQWDTNPVVSLQPFQADNVTPDAAAGDSFGIGVSVSVGAAAQNYILVSAQNNSDGGVQSGSAYLYQEQSPGVWQQVQKLLASDAAAQDHFGNAVTAYGEVAVVGAQDKIIAALDSGAVYAYHDTTDTDGDGLADQVERQICIETANLVCTSTVLADSDGDGLSDADEIGYGGGSGSYDSGDLNPVAADSDGDGVIDGVEVVAGNDPLDPADTTLYGDINGDDSIDATDILLGTRMVAGLMSWTPAQLARANVAPLVGGVPAPADAVIGADDLLIINRWAQLN